MPRRHARTQPAPRAVRTSRLSGVGGLSDTGDLLSCRDGRFTGILDGRGGAGHDGGMSIIMHDLAGADPELRFSPYCWRTRFALAHKGLPVETVPWRFTEREALAFSGQGKVPVIQDEGRVVSDSWSIAEYLEEQVPTPTLFGGSGGRAHALFINSWADAVLVGGIARLIVRDIVDMIDPKDRDYFRSSREARFGCSLEEVQAGRDDRLAAFRDLLVPVRLVLRRQDWLGGAAPSYADHIVAGTLMWPRCASRIALLEDNDPVAQWQRRVLDLYGGLGRSALRV
jgi:glutathione S-transferase